MDTDGSAIVEPSPLTRDVGWIGAGKMGAPMIRNLMAHGTRVAVTDPAASNLLDLIANGAAEARSPADHATSRIVFSTLPNDKILLDVVMGGADHVGLAETLSAGTTFVEMSTVSPVCSDRIAKVLSAKGIRYLRAPLSGSTAMADNATLTILASGDPAGWETALPYLRIISARQFNLGTGDEARYMKLVLNTLVGASSAVLAEALALGQSGGLSRATMMEVIGESAVASPLLNYKTDAVVHDDFTPAFTIAQMIKDFTLISDAARLQGVPLFTTGLILELYRAAANAGLKEEDFFALVKWHAQAQPK